MKIYNFRCVQRLPITQAEAWDFFSSPKNLALITPKKLNFEILSSSGGEKMHAGQVIIYKISVLPFIRLRWKTVISDVQGLHSFTDEQKSGPYALWRHVHRFREIENGVEMTDELSYALPLGLMGRLARWIFVEAEVNRIFNYRFKALETIFPAGKIQSQ